jgi:hypothetical protein
MKPKRGFILLTTNVIEEKIMHIDNPYSADYQFTITEKNFEVKFTGKCECGMSGPIYGDLKLQKSKLIECAMACVLYNEELNEFGYMTWKAKNGGASIDIHILNLDNNQESITEIQFDAYKFESITKDYISLISDQTGKKEKVARIHV